MIAVVVPSNRPESLARWRDAWADHLAAHDARLYVVKDEPVTWAQIAKDLGKDAWIIPRQTDCIRAYGYYQAWRDGADIIATMDDDCYPDDPDWIGGHQLVLATTQLRDWTSTIDTPGVRPRGLPRSAEQPVGISMGLWSHVPDLDAETQLNVDWASYQPSVGGVVPRGHFFPMSGMNLAWRRDLTPLMYFTLMGSHLTTGEPWHGMHRYGDIFAGLFAKRICDHLGYAVRFGDPLVRHDRASDPHANLERERVAKAANEWLWHVVRDAPLTARTPIECYVELAESIGRIRGHPYWPVLAQAMLTWTTLFTKETA
jgi:hypothetical protein